MSVDGAVPGVARRRGRRRAAGLHVEVNEGEVVLDIIHRLQATQAPRPRGALELQGRQVRLVQRRDQRPPAAAVHDPDVAPSPRTRSITVTPLRAFPVIRDLVTDVSFNYEKARRDPVVRAAGRRRARRVPDAAGRRRAVAGVPQVHRVLPVPGRLPRRPRPRGEQEGVRRAAVPHPDRRAGHAPARRPHRPPGRTRRTSTGIGCATSPSAAPRSAPSTSRSPTTRSSR